MDIIFEIRLMQRQFCEKRDKTPLRSRAANGVTSKEKIVPVLESKIALMKKRTIKCWH